MALFFCGVCSSLRNEFAMAAGSPRIVTERETNALVDRRMRIKKEYGRWIGLWVFEIHFA